MTLFNECIPIKTSGVGYLYIITQLRTFCMSAEQGEYYRNARSSRSRMSESRVVCRLCNCDRDRDSVVVRLVATERVHS